MEDKKRAEALFLLYLLFILFLILVHRAILFRCGGQLLYSYDDAYIHMAMAKNLVRHGVLGITRFSYTPASSSPLWTLLLAGGYLVLGVNTWLPLALNLIFAFLLIWEVWSLFEDLRLSRQFLLTGLFLLALPIYLILYSGMEHTLHILLVFLLARRFLFYLENGKLGWGFYILMALAMGARYETVFILALILGYFLWEKKWLQALAAFVSALPFPLLYGALNLAHGWGFLPASVAVKGKSVTLRYFLQGKILDGFASFLHGLKFRMTSFTTPTLSLEIFIFFLLAFLFFVLFLSGEKKWPIYLFPSFLVILHFTFAYYTYPPRYQNYILAFTLPFLLEALRELRPRRRLAPFLLAAVGMGFFVPRFLMNYNTPIGSEGLFSQQYQMARFVGRFFPKGKVVLNDIGAVAFYNENVRIVDFVGLATKEVYKIKVSPIPVEDRRALIKNFLSKEGADFAVAFEDWIAPVLPEDWKETGRWRLLRNLVNARREVVFYEVKAPNLAVKLRLNSAFLPDVVETGAYTGLKGLISWRDYHLWEPEGVLMLKPGGGVKIPLELPPGDYQVFIRARGIGAVLKVIPPGKALRLDKFSFFPYSVFLRFEEGEISLKNESSLPLLVREVLFKGPGENLVQMPEIIIQGK